MKVLLCVDASEATEHAVEFVGKIFGGTARSNLSITLLNIAESLPADAVNPTAGATCSEASAAQTAQTADQQGQRALSAAREQLQKSGVAADVHEKLLPVQCLPESRLVAAALAIIEEMKSGGYDIVCVGRRNAKNLGGSVIGGLAEKVAREAAGRTVWIVD